MTMDQEEKDLVATLTIASSVAVIDSYSKVMTGVLSAYTMSLEAEDRKAAVSLASEALQGLLWEVKLLRFLRDRPDKESPDHL